MWESNLQPYSRMAEHARLIVALKSGSTGRDSAVPSSAEQRLHACGIPPSRIEDEVGQFVTGIRRSLAQVSANNPDSARRIKQSASAMSSLQQKVQALALDLRPALLDELGFLAALTSLIFRFKQQTGLEVTGQDFGPYRMQASSDMLSAAYCAVQESLTNVARHTDVGRAAVHIDNSPGYETHISADLPASAGPPLPRTSVAQPESGSPSCDLHSGGEVMR